MASGNSLNCNSTGVVSYNATTGVFAGSAITQHNVLTGGASNAISSVAPGTSGNVLTSNGTDWASTTPATSGQLVLIQSQNGGAVTVIDFTTGTSTYKTHLLVFRNFVPQTDDRYLELQVSTDGGSSWVSTGYTSGININAYNANSLTNTTSTSAILLSASTNNTTLYGASGFIYLYGTNTTGKCCATGQFIERRTAADTYFGNIFANTDTGSANAFRLLLNGSGNIAEGNFTLYGLKET